MELADAEKWMKEFYEKKRLDRIRTFYSRRLFNGGSRRIGPGCQGV
ncbi:hypothetical protein BSMD_011790 [Bacillus subtilis Miyagi-4]|nr:hypothetical protein BSMD_011790 [Bacillus subtilis Miyagi-4]